MSLLASVSSGVGWERCHLAPGFPQGSARREAPGHWLPAGANGISYHLCVSSALPKHFKCTHDFVSLKTMGGRGGWVATTPILACHVSHPNSYDFCALPSGPVCRLHGAVCLQFPAVKPKGKGHRKQPDTCKVTLAQVFPVVPNLQSSEKP